jgi:hypothetical protein
MRKVCKTTDVGRCTRTRMSSNATYAVVSHFLTLAARSPRATALRQWSLKKPLIADLYGCRLGALVVSS